MFNKILITGGSGLLAVNWAATVKSKYRVVLGLHNRMISMPDTETYIIDLESVRSINDALNKIQPDLVIHTVAYTDVDGCQKYPELAKHINVDLAVNVATACSNSSVPLVHISTDHLYTGEKSFINEDEIIHPINVYGSTKAAAEQKVLKIHPETLVIRTNFFGWGPPYHRSFSDFVVDSLRSNKRIELFKDVFFTPILIEYLVNAVHKLVEMRLCGIFNVVGDTKLSKYDFGIKLAGVFGLDTTNIYHSSFSCKTSITRRPADMSLSNRKVCLALGNSLCNIENQLLALKRQEQTGFKKQLDNMDFN